MRGNIVHDALYRQHPLRPAEATKGRVGHGVGLEPFRQDFNIRQPIAIVGMEHRPVVDRGGQIDRGAAARGETQMQRQYMALRVETDIIGDAEGVPLARHHHVIVPVAAEFGGAARFVRDQRGRRGEQSRLRFLATKGAAHAAYLHRHVGGAAMQHMGDQMLDFAGMLGGTEQMNLAIFARCRDSDLPLQIEMILPAHIEAASHAMGRAGQRSSSIAARHPLGRFDQ